MKDEITAQSVRTLFRAVLRGNDRIPGTAACREVAAWLQFLRLRRKREIDKMDGAGLDAGKGFRAARTVLAELARVEENYKQFQRDIASVPALPFLEQALRDRTRIAADVRDARASIERIMPLFAPRAAKGPGWHAEAAGLYRIFLAAMKDANPERRYAPSNEGAAVRFIRAAFALALGEERQETAIAQVLKRQRRAGTSLSSAPSRDSG